MKKLILAAITFAIHLSPTPLVSMEKIEKPAPHNQDHQVLQQLEEICVICQNELISSKHQVFLRCTHSFHKPCISRWVSENKNSRNCPTCKNPHTKEVLKELDFYTKQYKNNPKLYKQELKKVLSEQTVLKEEAVKKENEKRAQEQEQNARNNTTTSSLSAIPYNPENEAHNEAEIDETLDNSLFDELSAETNQLLVPKDMDPHTLMTLIEQMEQKHHDLSRNQSNEIFQEKPVPVDTHLRDDLKSVALQPVVQQGYFKRLTAKVFSKKFIGIVLVGSCIMKSGDFMKNLVINSVPYSFTSYVGYFGMQAFFRTAVQTLREQFIPDYRQTLGNRAGIAAMVGEALLCTYAMHSMLS